MAFMDDGLFSAMRIDAGKALKLFSPYALAVLSYFGLATLPSFI